MKSLSFNGIRKPWLYLLEGRQKAPFAPITRNLLRIPGRPGAILQSSETEPLIIYQPIGFVVKDDADALAKKDELASWLVTDNPVPLEFDDEPGRTYYAVVQNTIADFEQFVNQRRGTIEFLILDGYGYGPELEAVFPSDIVTLTNNGTAEAEPVFELTVKKPVTFAMIQNQNEEYMMIGKPIDVIDTPYTKYERVFYSDCDSLSGWTTAAPGEIDGNITGTMETNGTRFQAASYGTGSGWHGPAIKTSLPEALTDFRMSTFVGFFNKAVARQVGRIELYLLDENGNKVCKIAMKDTRTGQSLAWGEAIAGQLGAGKFLINEYGDRPGNWNNFNGHMQIEREGNVWRAYFAMVDTSTGRHHTRRSVTWVDTGNKYTRNVAQIVVHHGQYGSHEPVTGGVYSINVFRINPEQSNKVPYIAEAGDIITFDHTTKDILINGESRKDLKDFGARFFHLQKGENQFVVLPSDSFSVKVRYRERFL